MKGLFITFEGGEGAGKTTQIGLLEDKLKSQGYEVLVTREPGGTFVGEELRHILKHSKHPLTPRGEVFLLNASRAQLVDDVIIPSISAGKIVLCDRFYDSTIAYQGYGWGLDIASLRASINFAIGGLKPDLTFLLQISLEESALTVRARRANLSPELDRFEDLAGQEFFERVNRGYKLIAEQESERVKVIPFIHKGIKETHEIITGYVAEYIYVKEHKVP